MPAPAVQTIEGERSASGRRRPGDVSTAVLVGAALRGPVDRVFEVAWSDLDTFVGSAFGASHLRRACDAFFAEGGTRLFVSRAVPASGPVVATANITDATTGVVLVATADGPGAFGNAITLDIAAGSTSDRRMFIVKDAGAVKAQVEVGSTAEAIARVAKPGTLKLTAGAAVWPPKITTVPITLATGVSNDSSVAASDVVAAIGRIPKSVGPCTVAAPGHTTQVVHEAVMRLARTRGWHYHLDLPDIADTATLRASAAALRALDEEKPGRYGKLLWPWELVSIGPWLNVPVPPSASQAGRDARADREDPQGAARPAAGVDYVSRHSVDVTRTPTDDDADLLADAGITVIRREPEGVCAWDVITLVDPDKWPQYLFSAGARVRMAIVDEARLAVRRRLFPTLDSEGLTVEQIRGAVVNACRPWATRGALYSENDDGGYSVQVMSGGDDIRQGRVRIRLGLRCAPNVRMVVIEFTAVALGDQL